jgi:hydroxymethylpyrimidine/phosphomethylpyrimidine kinase
MTPPVALTIAGSDSGGGAGIQADLKMFSALGVFGTSAITAVTAQNTVGVDLVDVLDGQTVAAQIDAVMTDQRPVAAKTGMLACTEIIDLVADRAAADRLPPLVVDPVMVASSGDRLLDDEAEAAYLEHLFPHAHIITPNLREASVLVGREVTTVDEMVTAAVELAATGPDWVVVKGGHLDGAAVDVVHERRTGRVTRLTAPRIETRNNHGTGCSFAAAITAGLALGRGPEDAIAEAKLVVTRAIDRAASWRLGAGHGPIDHFGWGSTEPRPAGAEDTTSKRPTP